jgi:SAM-dependent methyltransferase
LAAERLLHTLQQTQPAPGRILDLIVATDIAHNSLILNPLLCKVTANAKYLPFLPQSFGVISANCLLQWLPNTIEAIQYWLTLLQPGGILALTTFAHGTFAEWYTALAATALPHPPMDFVAPSRLKQSLAAYNPLLREEKIALHYPDATAFLRAVHKLGAGSASLYAHPIPTSMMRRAMAHYNSTAQSYGITATYKLLTVMLKNS